jgi:hypothetical protein
MNGMRVCIYSSELCDDAGLLRCETEFRPNWEGDCARILFIVLYGKVKEVRGWDGAVRSDWLWLMVVGCSVV